MTPPVIPRLQLAIWEIVELEKAMRSRLPYTDNREWAIELLKKLQQCEALHFTMRRDRSKPKQPQVVATAPDGGVTSDV